MPGCGVTEVSETVRVSLRDISESAYRAFRAHGATHGEASITAQMVLQAEISGGRGIEAIVEDRAAPPWSQQPLDLSDVSSGAGTHLVLQSGLGGWIRVAPFAVELLASADARITAIPLVAARQGTTVVDLTLLDALTQELSRVCGVGFAAVSVPAGLVRWARPDGSMGIGAVEETPASWHEGLLAGGVVVMRDASHLRTADLRWVGPGERRQARAALGRAGVQVDSVLWYRARAAARGFSSPRADRYAAQWTADARALTPPLIPACPGPEGP